MRRVVELLMELPGWAILALVAALPLLEASTFLGILIPGETALLAGGVLASTDRVSFWQVAAAGSAGAAVGDSIGYWIGARYGERLLAERAARLVGPARLERARRHLRERGFAAVALGRVVPALRSLVPGLAGAARMPYGRFLLANGLSALAWGAGSVGVGYAVGEAWHRLEPLHDLSMALVLLLLLLLVGWTATRARRERTGRA